jgi:hypothetical protein
MRHFVKLSNGETVVLIEEDSSLSIGLGDEEDGVDLYIAQITLDGVLSYSTASYAPDTLVRGLKYEHI